MSTEYSSVDPVPEPHSPIHRARHPSIISQQENRPPQCGVEELRAELARKTSLLHDTQILLQEQEELQRESDHRLLNGLQMIVSLLSLQSRTALTADVAIQLSTAAHRVAIVERVHRRLHCNDDTKTVELKKFLRELCQDYAGFAGFGDGPQASILFEGREIEIPGKTAISLGFIASELITNAIKHGEGRIIVRLDTGPGKGHAMSVCNGGSPLPDGFDPAQCSGLGMKIIRSLVQKIGGQFEFGPGTDNQGACFVVSFP